MYPEDRVLVGVMPDPQDFELARDRHWYRVPAKHAPKGIHAEYVAFYFTSKFPEDLRWAIHFYARRTGHEMARRIDLFPDQPNHPRAQERYYKLQLGPLKQKHPPILSLRWRRITFIQTTWERFTAAHEINDLFRNDNVLVEQIYHTLKGMRVYAERAVEVQEGQEKYIIDLLVPCKHGSVMLSTNANRPSKALMLSGDQSQTFEAIRSAIRENGGPLMRTEETSRSRSE
ncbi:MAG: hypothetical protein JXB07_05475 [Anaerolineae bacterium]|nr:hypothetical protein [Anaerolineae bacterium]